MKTKFFSLFLALTTAGTIFASDIVINKIWYNLDDVAKTAEVTFKGDEYSERDNRYTGAVRIPAQVKYNGETYDVTSIGKNAFAGCKNLTSVTLPNSITTIGSSAFSLCYDLNKINIPASVTTIEGYAFNACLSLLDLTIPSTVTTIGGSAFNLVANVINEGGSAYGARSVNGFVNGYLVYADNTKTKLCACSHLANGKLKLPETLEEIGGLAFIYCADLDALTLPNSIQSVGSNAFYGCAAMLSLTVPKTIATIGASAFFDVPNVIYEGSLSGSPWGAKSVNGYVDGNLVYEDEEHTILKAANCKLIGNINLPNTVKIIGQRAFASQFSKTTSVMMGSGIEELKPSAFYDCNLTSVVIPATVKTIGAQVFYNCWNITSFICEANTPPTCGSSMLPTVTTEGVTHILHRIYVPANSVDAYKSQWSSYYKDSIFAITAETSVIGSNDIAVSPEDVTARIKWPKFDDAVGYAVEIKDKDDVVKFAYSFDGEGVLRNTFAAAPGFGGPRGSVQNLEAAQKCWQFDIEGLEPNTKYTVHIVAADAAANELFNKTKSFTTKKRQAIDQINGQSQMTNVKYIEDGKLFIRRGDKTYTVSGQVVE